MPLQGAVAERYEQIELMTGPRPTTGRPPQRAPALRRIRSGSERYPAPGTAGASGPGFAATGLLQALTAGLVAGLFFPGPFSGTAIAGAAEPRLRTAQAETPSATTPAKPLSPIERAAEILRRERAAQAEREDAGRAAPPAPANSGRRLPMLGASDPPPRPIRPGGSALEQLERIAAARRGIEETVVLTRDFSAPPPACSGCAEGVFLNGNHPANGPLASIEDGWLKFTVRSNTGAGAGGNYFVKFPEGAAGPGESLYVRWQQRFDSAFLASSKLGAGFKIAIVGDAGQNSCSSNEIVLADLYGRNFVQGYHACGRFEPFERGHDPSRRYQYNYQPGGDNGCWSGTKTFPDEAGGCFRLVPDEVFTFELRIDVAAHPADNSRIRLWLSRESRARELVFDLRRVLYDSAKGYGAVWLLPYNTRKKPDAAHPDGHTWYDNLHVAKVRGEAQE